MEQIKISLLSEGDTIDYEDLLLSVVGSALTRIPCMYTSESGRDTFIADGDYDLIIRKNNNKKK